MSKDAVAHPSAPQTASDSVQLQTDSEYEAWFLAEVEASLREADDPNTVWIPHEVVQADMERQRQSFLARLSAQSKSAGD